MVLPAAQILNLPEAFPHGEGKRKRPFRGQQKLIILSFPARKLCVFERPCSLSVYHFRKVLKSPLGNSLYLDSFFFFLSPKRTLQSNDTFGSKNVLSKKMKLLYYDLYHEPCFLKKNLTIQFFCNTFSKY